MTKKDNDTLILALKKELWVKRKALAVATNFKAKTNLMLTLNNVIYNLNTLNKVSLALLASQLVSLQVNMKVLGLEEDLEVSGFTITEWISDLVGKFHLANKKEEEKKLLLLEVRLEKLVSAELKEKIELDDIINSMK